MDIVKLIIVMTKQQAESLLFNKRVESIDSMPHIDPKVKQVIRDYMEENVGYSNTPIAGLSKWNGEPSDLREVQTNVGDYIKLQKDNVMFELHVPRDLVISVNFEDLINISTQVSRSTRDFEVEFYLDELKDRLHVGYSENDAEDLISFVPFVDLRTCKLFALINPTWDIGDYDIPGLEQVNLRDMNLF